MVKVGLSQVSLMVQVPAEDLTDCRTVDVAGFRDSKPIRPATNQLFSAGIFVADDSQESSLSAFGLVLPATERKAHQSR